MHHAMRAGRAFDPRIYGLLAMTGRGGRHGHGGPGRGGPWGGGEPGFGFPGGGPFGFGGRGGRRRMRRGDVRAALLVLLDEEPRNGYGLIQELERRTDGVWRPSPGSVYPALSLLEDEGLVRAQETEGRKLFELTDAGRAYVADNRDELGKPWEAVNEDVDEGALDLRKLIGQVAAAAMQVKQAGSAAQAERASEVLAEARRSLYRILADDEPDTDPEDPA
jgi:DNA-binding PadR family transcriptional regulator